MAKNMGMPLNPDLQREALKFRSATIQKDPKMVQITSMLQANSAEADEQSLDKPLDRAKSQTLLPGVGLRRSEALRTGGCGLVDQRMKEIERELRSPLSNNNGRRRFLFDGGASPSKGTSHSPMAGGIERPRSGLSTSTSATALHGGAGAGGGVGGLGGVGGGGGGSASGSKTPTAPPPPLSGKSVSGHGANHSGHGHMMVPSTTSIEEEERIKEEHLQRIAVFDPESAKGNYRHNTDRTMKRLLIDIELARDTERHKHHSHQMRCDNLDKSHLWYSKWSLKEDKKKLAPSPPYLTFSTEGPVSPGSLRVQIRQTSPLLKGPPGLSHSTSSPALLVPGTPGTPTASPK